MTSSQKLHRTVGLTGALFMGLGSIIGTGVFVSLGLAADLAGPWMIFSLLIAGALATCNGLSTAQLAAVHPVSGGTYEYAYRLVHPWAGYSAGWMFICAKSASAATAAIGFGAYFVQLFQLDQTAPWEVGLVATTLLIIVSALGMRRSSSINIVIVSITFLSLIAFVLVAIPSIDLSHLKLNLIQPTFSRFWEATALMFVAYTGYGRIATLGEEIREPIKNIPKAIVMTLGLSFVLYLLVSTSAIGTVGATSFASYTLNDKAPLEAIASTLEKPHLRLFLSLGAMTAMLGVLLNLILGLSRVFYAMGTRNDLPKSFTYLSQGNKTPTIAVLGAGLVILSLVLLKEVRSTWSFSAFTVLIYYAFTNLSALRLPKQRRLYPRTFAWIGLLGCLSLGAWVDIDAILLGTVILGFGAFVRILRRNT